MAEMKNNNINVRLNEIVKNELSKKKSEIDDSVVAVCVDCLLAEREESEYQMSKVQKESSIEQLKQQAHTNIDRRNFAKTLTMFAAVAIILFSASFVAIKSMHNSTKVMAEIPSTSAYGEKNILSDANMLGETSTDQADLYGGVNNFAGESVFDYTINKYRSIIEQINEDYDVEMVLDSSDEEHIFEFYRNYTFIEVEYSMRRNIKSFLNDDFSDSISLDDDGEYDLMSQQGSIIQKQISLYNTKIVLSSNVIRSGDPIIYKYSKINYVDWIKNKSGWYFNITKINYTISKDKKSCNITLKGNPKNADGTMLETTKYAKVNFEAN